MPCWEASPKLEYGARTIRKKIHDQLSSYFTEFPPLVKHPHKPKSIPEVSTISDTVTNSLVVNQCWAILKKLALWNHHTEQTGTGTRTMTDNRSLSLSQFRLYCESFHTVSSNPFILYLYPWLITSSSLICIMYDKRNLANGLGSSACQFRVRPRRSWSWLGRTRYCCGPQDAGIVHQTKAKIFRWQSEWSY